MDIMQSTQTNENFFRSSHLSVWYCFAKRKHVPNFWLMSMLMNFWLYDYTSIWISLYLIRTVSPMHVLEIWSENSLELQYNSLSNMFSIDCIGLCENLIIPSHARVVLLPKHCIAMFRLYYSDNRNINNGLKICMDTEVVGLRKNSARARLEYAAVPNPAKCILSLTRGATNW